jgi:tetratricopeptide (TPR) repeat protein
MSSWSELAEFIAALDAEDRAKVGRYAFLELPENAGEIELLLSAPENPAATPAQFVSNVISQAASARDLDLARKLGPVALDAAETPGDLQLAHASLAQAYFQNRRDPESAKSFEKHCRAAIEAGHAGTFCYERLAALYEYRGDLEEALRISHRAAEVLRAAGDERSAARFEKRAERLSRKSR